MKSIAVILASVLCAGSPAPVETTERASTQQNSTNRFFLGKEVVQSVHAGFSDGKYTDFLNEMDTDYQKAKKNNQLEGLIEIRKDTGSTQINPEFAKAYGIIQKAKNQDLLKIVDKDHSQFGDKVRSSAQSVNDVDPRLLSLNYKAPGTGANSDENALIEISLEYYYKGIHLDSFDAVNPVKDRKERHMALEVQKMNKMLEASKTFSDKELKLAVEDAAKNLDTRMAKSYDTSDLLALGKGKVKPASSLEEKAAAIVSSSQGDLADLHRKLLDSLNDEKTK